MAPTQSNQDSSDADERRDRILSSLAAQPSCSRADAKAAGAKLGLSERQIYNWVRKLRSASGTHGGVVRRGSRTTKGVMRLPPHQEAHLGRIIAEEIAKRPDGVVSGLFAALVKRCPQEMSPAPSASTIFRRLRARIACGSPRMVPRHPAIEEAPSLPRERLTAASAEALLSPLYGTGERRPVGPATLTDSEVPHGDPLRTEYYNNWCVAEQDRCHAGIDGTPADPNGTSARSDLFLEGRAGLEAHGLAGLDLDRLAGAGIERLAGLGLLHGESTE
jgi:hypothetical protein